MTRNVFPMIDKHILTIPSSTSIEENLDEYTIMLKLHAGSRVPQNDYERRLLKEMRGIEARGEQVDFTENIW